MSVTAPLPYESRIPLGIAVWLGLLALAGVVLMCINAEGFIADDSYFYMVIARNIAAHGYQSFSNIFPTNGFHPLWGYVLAAYSWVAHLISPEQLYRPEFALPLGVALLVGIGVQCWRLARCLELDPLVLTAVVIGFNLTRSVLMSEGPLFTLLVLTLLIELARDRDAAANRPILFGLIAGATVLARLDAVFFIAIVGLYAFLLSHHKVRVVVAGAICCAIVAAYVVSNMIYFGGAMPISGWMKSSFPSIHLQGFNWSGMQTAFAGYNVILGWVPIILGAAAWLVIRDVTPPQRRVQLLLLGGSVLHCMYVGLFTRSFETTSWPWYYVLPVLLLAVTIGMLARQGWPMFGRPVLVAAISLVVVMGYVQRYTAVATPAWPVINHLKEGGVSGETVLLSDWPGAIAFFTDDNILAADMLTYSRRRFEEMRKSDNALEFLIAECKSHGAPIREIVLVGSLWLQFDREAMTLTYNDPRVYPTLHVPIGMLNVQEGEKGALTCGDGIRIWFAPHYLSSQPQDLRRPASGGHTNKPDARLGITP